MFNSFIEEQQYNRFFEIVKAKEIYEKWRQANEYLNNQPILPVKIVKKNIKHYADILFSKNIYICGGSANFYYSDNGRLKDIDIFITGNINEFRFTFSKLKNLLENKHQKLGLKSVETYYTYSIFIEGLYFQIIKKVYKNVNEILSNFDLSCCRIAFNSENYFMTPDYEFCSKTKTIGTNYMVNSVSYLNRLGKYKEFFRIILADVCIEKGIIKDKINKKKLYFTGEEVYSYGGKGGYYYDNNNRFKPCYCTDYYSNILALISSDYNFLKVINGKILLTSKISNYEMQEIKIYIATHYKEFDSIFTTNEMFMDKFKEVFADILVEQEINIKNYLNIENIKCFSFGNRQTLKGPEEYYENKTIPHLNIKNFGLIALNKKCLSHFIWCLPVKLPKYLVLEITRLIDF